MIATDLLVKCDNEPVNTLGGHGSKCKQLVAMGLAAEGLLAWALPAPFSVCGKHKANAEAAL